MSALKHRQRECLFQQPLKVSYKCTMIPKNSKQICEKQPNKKACLLSKSKPLELEKLKSLRSSSSCIYLVRCLTTRFLKSKY